MPVAVRMSAVVAALLVSVLIACEEVATGGGVTMTICDTAKCGKSTCSEMSGPAPFVPWCLAVALACCDQRWRRSCLRRLPNVRAPGGCDPEMQTRAKHREGACCGSRAP